MLMSEELGKLDELHQRGALSDGEFSRAKARVLGQTGPGRSGPGVSALNRLERSRSDRWLAGVCGGLAELTGLAAWIWRLIFALSVLCAGTGVAIYILLWIFVPGAHAQPGSGARELA
jgi:phage shock protein PspC (stress-responsive transcriptional regulator)